MNDTLYFSNPRAQACFDNSGLPAGLARAVRAEALYIMNVVGMRYSDAVHSAVQAAKRGEWASPMAKSIMAIV